MKITETKIIEHTNIRDVICNKCGGTLLRGMPNEEHPYGLVEHTYTGSYDSGPGFRDFNVYTFSVCEACLWEFTKTFKISMSDPDDPFRDSSNQQKINKIHKITTKKDLAIYLMDEDNIVREYAKIKLEEIG